MGLNQKFALGANGSGRYSCMVDECSAYRHNHAPVRTAWLACYWANLLTHPDVALQVQSVKAMQARAKVLSVAMMATQEVDMVGHSHHTPYPRNKACLSQKLFHLEHAH